MGKSENNDGEGGIDPHKIMRNAIELINNGNQKEGFYFYDIFLKNDIKDTELICYFGNSLYKRGYLNKAYCLYQKAISIDDSLSNIHSNMGLIQLERGLLIEAELSTRKAIKLNH